MPQFEQRIKDGVKVHTIRADRSNRWKVGMKIHFWLGNQRNTRGKIKPYQFGLGEVSDLQRIEIDSRHDRVIIEDYAYSTIDALNDIAVNDGFDSWQDMKLFFHNSFEGWLIIWKNFTPTNP